MMGRLTYKQQIYYLQFVDDKTRTRYKMEIKLMTNPERDQGKRAEAGYHNKL